MKQQSFSPDIAFFRGKFPIGVARSRHAMPTAEKASLS